MLPLASLLQEMERETGTSILSLALVLARVMPVCTLAPWLFLRGVPAPVRAGVAVVLSLAFAPFATPGAHTSFVAALTVEALRGTAFALATALPWIAFDVLFRAADQSRNQSGDQSISPLGLDKGSSLSGAGALLLGALFVSAGGLRRACEALGASFVRTPLGQLQGHPDLRAFCLGVARELTDALVIGVRIATPLLVAVWLVDIGLALVSRAGGSLSLHFAAMPLRVLVSLGALLFCLSLAWPQIHALFAHALHLATLWVDA